MGGWWRRRTLPKAEAERLLDGGAGDSAVADLLRAASGPARPGELAGERAAVAAFRQEYARAAAAHQGAVRRQPVRRARLRRVSATGSRCSPPRSPSARSPVPGSPPGRPVPAPLQRAAHDWIDQVPEPNPRRSQQQTVRAGSPTPPVPQGPSAPRPPPARAPPAPLPQRTSKSSARNGKRSATTRTTTHGPGGPAGVDGRGRRAGADRGLLRPHSERFHARAARSARAPDRRKSRPVAETRDVIACPALSTTTADDRATGWTPWTGPRTAQHDRRRTVVPARERGAAGGGAPAARADRRRPGRRGAQRRPRVAAAASPRRARRRAEV